VRRLAVVGVVVATLLTSCGGKEEPLGPTATVPQGTTTTNPYAIPPVIDAAYVNRVLAGLDQVIGDAVRLVVKNRVVDEEVYYRLSSVYLGDTLQLNLDGIQEDLLGGMRGYRETPGNNVTTVTRLITATNTCVFAEVVKDYAPVNASGQANLSTQWVALVPLDFQRDVRHYNPTSWILLYEGFRDDLTQPADPCLEDS
jgi:hypothetical protein